MAETFELVVCTTCRLPGSDPDAPSDGARLSEALERHGIAHRRQPCLCACDHGCAVVLRGRGRWTYVQGALSPMHDIPDLIAMYRAYGASADGQVPWRMRPEVIRKNIIARIPPIEV
ncbi:DUF1636 domain-containing protein [Paracoccus sp. (in: a-proteobacteria)]|uniref:DUF1636 domain-containing protein n=1 Tax=Paracoccus sp. TaxID=267 RepID=UPI00322000E1